MGVGVNMTNELYHRRIGRGFQKADHKYTRREWKNGKWIYYYDDGTSKVMKPGQNYLTVEQAKAEKDAETKAIVERQAKEKAKQDRITEIDKKIDSWFKKGKEAAEKLDTFWDSTPSELFYYLKNKKP